MRLPNKLKPKFLYDLSRIGSNHDGGYLIEKSSHAKSKFLFSFGVSTNWEFEKDFIRNKRINFLAFDGSVTDIFWKNQKSIALNRLKKLSISKFFEYIYLKYSFNNFFNNENFIPKFISKTMNNSITLNEANLLSEVKDNLFFKIDIEGSEYEIIDDLIKFQKSIIGLAIEFHFCDQNINKILNFVDRFGLEIVHVHANNYEDNRNKKFPGTLEISFAKNPKILDDFKTLPHKLDSPNRKKNAEIKLEFYE